MTATEAHSRQERFAQARALARTDPAEALALADALHVEAGRSGDRVWRARAQIVMGICHWQRSDFVTALRTLLEALGLLEDHEHDDRALALQHLATVHTYLGEHDRATELLVEALRLRERTGDARGRADVLNNLGIVFWRHGDLEEALEAYERARALRAELGDAHGVAAVANNRAKALIDLGRHEEALVELEASCRAWERLEEWFGLAMALTNAGSALEGLGRDAHAEAYYRAALAMKESIDAGIGICETEQLLGRLLARRGRLEEAEDLLERAVDRAERLGGRRELADALRDLSWVHERAGDAVRALAAFQRFHAVERARFDETSDLRLRGLQVAYQLEQARRESSTDALTGLPNRRYLDQRLRDEVQRAQAEAAPLAVALLDLDDFKRINDELSHAVGDSVLRRLGSLLRHRTRAEDLAARYGGEEFVVILTGAERDGALVAGQDLCEAVREHPWAEVHADLAVTVSVGVAAREGGETAEQLLAEADRRLYEAKHAGKDRVRG